LDKWIKSENQVVAAYSAKRCWISKKGFLQHIGIVKSPSQPRILRHSPKAIAKVLNHRLQLVEYCPSAIITAPLRRLSTKTSIMHLPPVAMKAADVTELSGRSIHISHPDHRTPQQKNHSIPNPVSHAEVVHVNAIPGEFAMLGAGALPTVRSIRFRR